MTSPVEKSYREVSTPHSDGKQSALALAQSAGLVGCVDGGPPDLAGNRDYLDNWGESQLAQLTALVQYLLDTGPLVALLQRNSEFHDWVRQRFECAETPLLTCEPVVAEACHLLGKAKIEGQQHVLEAFKVGLFSVEFSLASNLDCVDRVIRKYGGRPDLADACLVCMAEQHPSRPILTIDSDFYAYTKPDGSPLSILSIEAAR